MSPRPGFVLEVDSSTPPTLFWHGEGFRLERLPSGSRVLYPPEPLDPLVDPDRGHPPRTAPSPRRRRAPAGAAAPGDAPHHRLRRRLAPAATHAAPRRPPTGHRAVLDLAAEAGVDDVVLICALALHRRMTEAELRHAVGDRVYDAFAPHGLLQQHDAEDPDNLIHLGLTDQGEDVEINKRAADRGPARLRQHQPGGDGRRAQVGGHRSGQLPQPAAPPQRPHHAAQPIVHGPAPLGAALLELAHGTPDRRCRRQGLPDRDQSQHRHLPSAVPLPRAPRVGVVDSRDRASFIATSASLARTPDRLARSIFHSVRSPYRLTSRAGRRGRGRARRARPRTSTRQQLVAVEGQTDILTLGLALHLPVQRQLDHEPDPRRLPGARLLLQHVPGPSARARGRRGHHEPPHPVGLPPRPPPELHRLLRAGPGRDDRPGRGRASTRRPTPPTPGTCTSTAPGTPTTASIRSTCGTGARTPSSISGGSSSWAATAPPCKRLGFTPASTMADALEMASDIVGRHPTLTHLHSPPLLMADVTP